jgi:two-component system sensor histidine kinase UhpB
LQWIEGDRDMEGLSEFFVQNLGYVYFFYGLAFFAMGLVAFLESGRSTEFRFGRALIPLALFGFIHGGHEWFEMFQISALQRGTAATGVPVELLRLVLLVVSFICLLAFGVRLLPNAEQEPAFAWTLVAALVGVWLVALGFLYVASRPSTVELLISGDVLARYLLAVPGALLAGWALLRERRDFHARGMSRYGRSLLWAALAFIIYGVVGQVFTRPSLVFPSTVLNSTLFLDTFGIPIQLLRTVAAIAIAIALGSALRAFEAEGRVRLARANKARLEALDAQARRAEEIESLNAELRQTTQELTAMLELSRTLTSTVDLGRLLHDALYQVVHSMEGSCCSMLFLRTPNGALEPAGIYRRPEAPRPDPPPPLAETARQAFLYEGATGARLDHVVVLFEDGAFEGGASYQTLGVPLRSQNRVFGALSLGSLHEAEPLSEKELGLMTAFAQQMAAAIENAQLYRMLQEREGALEDLVRQLVNAQEGERRRIARELHDDTGQRLTALGLGLAAVEGRLVEDNATAALDLVRNLRGVTDEAMTELHNIMANLRPAQLDELGLAPTLRWYVNDFGARNPDITVQLTVGRLPRRLPQQYETVLFRVVQEALTNVYRHAHASAVSVTLAQRPGAVCLEVRDNGLGFDPATLPAASAPERPSGWGIVGMRERVMLGGGRFDIVSQPGQGTTVTVELPWNPEENG